MQAGNLFTDAAPPSEGELFDTLLNHRNLVVERIVNSTLLAQQEYLQAQDKWVLLVKGEAVLRAVGESVSMKSGDYLFLLEVLAGGYASHGRAHVRRCDLVGGSSIP